MNYLVNILISRQSLTVNIRLFICFLLAYHLHNPVNAQSKMEIDIQVESEYQSTLHLSKFNREVSRREEEKEHETNVEQLETSEPIDFSPLGRSGQQTAGESRGSCPFVNIPLTVVAPKSNVSLTTKSHPKLWFYFPYDRSAVRRIEFSLLDESGNDVTRFDLPIPSNKSYISAVVPSNKQGLVVNSPYKWHLKVYCESNNRKVSSTFVSGFIGRVANSSSHAKSMKFSLQNVQRLVNEDLWIDAFNTLLNKGCNKTISLKKNVWLNLLSSDKIDLQLPNPLSAGSRFQHLN